MLRKFEIEFNEKYLFEWIDYWCLFSCATPNGVEPL